MFQDCYYKLHDCIQNLICICIVQHFWFFNCIIPTFIWKYMSSFIIFISCSFCVVIHFSESLSHSGGSLTPTVITNRGQMIGVGQQLRNTYDELAGTHPPSSTHTGPDRKQEVVNLASQLQPLELFSFKANRNGHGAFPDFIHSDAIPKSNDMYKPLQRCEQNLLTSTLCKSYTQMGQIKS